MAVRASAMLLVIVCAALCMKCAMGATQYTVGGSQGWELNADLSTWLSGKKFAPGDALVFKYGATHSVLEVSKADYDSCQISNAIQTHADGNTAVTLSSPGKRYFICGTPGHCSAGMKLEIDTVAAASAPRASPPLNAAPRASPPLNAAPQASPPASRTAPPVSAPSKVPVSSPSTSTPSSSAPATAPTPLTPQPPSSSPTEAPASAPSTVAAVPKSSSSPAPSPPSSESAANSLYGVGSLVVMTSAAAAVVAMAML